MPEIKPAVTQFDCHHVILEHRAALWRFVDDRGVDMPRFAVALHRPCLSAGERVPQFESGRPGHRPFLHHRSLPAGAQSSSLVHHFSLLFALLDVHLGRAL